MEKGKKKEEETEKRELAPRRDFPGWESGEVDRWFDDMLRDFENRFGDPFPWRFPSRLMVAPWRRFWASTTLPWRLPADVRAPPVDIEDKGTEFIVTAELPGVPKERLDVNVTADGVEISAEARKEEEEREKGYYRKERSYRRVYRRVPLPAEVVPDTAQAKMEHGLLTIRLLKREPTPEPKSHKVKVD